MSRYPVLLFLTWGLLSASALPSSSAFNEPSDGGASAHVTLHLPDRALTDPKLAARFPVGQRVRIHVLGGGVRGLGMLAEFNGDGPREVLVARETRVNEGEPYTPFALARVFDPNGTLVAVEDFTDQPTGRDVRILKVDTKKSGVWRVSFSGGRAGDRIEIRLPQTKTWGVRGEMSLGTSETFPKPAYLWIPPTSHRLLVGIETGNTEGITLRNANGGAAIGVPEADPTKRSGRILLKTPPQDTVVRLETPASYAGAVVVEGAPGLFCPTEEAALRLRGGVVESHGLLTAGPLQARARDWMVANAPLVKRERSFTFPSKIPDDLESPQLDVLMFGRYGFANTLGHMIGLQNARLDPTNPFFGVVRPAGWQAGGGPNWTNFWGPPASAGFAPAALASAATFESPLNPAYGDADLVRRTTLSVFAMLASQQGDDLLREGDLERSRYPMIHAFFNYPPALAQAYHSLHDHLDPEAKAIWRDGLIAMGDKLADFQGYQSNQWAHMILGHLEAYLGTGEKRFLRYFEKLMTAYVDNTFGNDGKFGLHPAGYFMEQYGPDGNYERLNSFCFVAAWLHYRELPEADLALLAKLHAGIERHIRFSSFFWLLTVNGDVVSPTAFNCRTTTAIGGLSYPGVLMAKSEFPLGLARYNLTTSPERGIGIAGTFSYTANNPEWIRAVIEDGLQRGADGYDTIGGVWVKHVHKAWEQPQRVEPGVIPVHDTGGTWEVPGLLAWNRDGLYGVVFADVVGATSVLNGFMGGGPAALWSPGTGPFLMSMTPSKPGSRIQSPQKQESPQGLTFSCVYGETADGDFFYTGKERAEIKTLAANERYEINAKLDAPFAGLVWRYDLQPDALTIEVALKARPAAKTAFVNLPLRTDETTQVKLESGHAVIIKGAQGRVRLSWPSTATGRLEPSVHSNIQRLVVPLPADGTALRLQVTQLSGPKA